MTAAAAEPRRIIVPFSPGGGIDAIARLIAEALPGSSIVENTPGAGGAIAAGRLLQSEPEGQIVMLAVFPTAAFEAKDFRVVATTSSAPTVVVSPHADLLGHAKTAELKYGSAGVGSPSHLMAAEFAVRNGLKVVHVPYKGTSPAFGDLLTARIDYMVVSRGAFSHERLYYKPYDVSVEHRLLAHRDTPPRILLGLKEAIYPVISSERFKDNLRRLGFESNERDHR